MIYTGIPFEKTITIPQLYSIHYFEYMNTFTFEGESHNFWEFVCADKGEVFITAGDKELRLKRGEIIFHEPNEFHAVRADGRSAPNLIVISFQCDSPAMDFFRHKKFQIDDAERILLANIVAEGRRTFASRLDDPYLATLVLREQRPAGSLQLIQGYIEEFLLHLLHRHNETALQKKIKSEIKSTKLRNDQEYFHRISEYMEAHLDSKITIEQLCHTYLIGRSQLQKVFHRNANMGAIEYFTSLKIRKAKELIRTSTMNFTQISYTLGYTSIHYFSRQFKKETGMTPSEYATSIKAISEHKNMES